MFWELMKLLQIKLKFGYIKQNDFDQAAKVAVAKWLKTE